MCIGEGHGRSVHVHMAPLFVSHNAAGKLSELLGLSHSCGGDGLHSLANKLDKLEIRVLLCGESAIVSFLITFCKKTEIPVYTNIVKASESMKGGA
jgi:hypothetical protein